MATEDWTTRPGRYVMGGEPQESEVIDWDAVKINVFPSTHRSRLLQEAERLICGDRNNQYGPPHQDFQRTAEVLTALGFRKDDPEAGEQEIRAHDVAIILAVVKLSRLMWSPGKFDSWVDLAGYAACGYEAYELTKGD